MGIFLTAFSSYLTKISWLIFSPKKETKISRLIINLSDFLLITPQQNVENVTSKKELEKISNFIKEKNSNLVVMR